MKKFLWILSCAVLAVCLMFILPTEAHAAEIVDSGTCGENLTWTLDDAGVLTISGIGDMTNWSINGSPWYLNYDIKTVVVKNGVTSVGDRAFNNCDSITSVTIPDSVTSIGDYAFYSCGCLTSVTIPDSVTSIGCFAFSFCENLTSVIIGDSVTSIGDDAFSYCNSLTSITIPDSVTSIGVSAFCDCRSLTGIWVSENNPSYSSDRRGVLFNKDMTVLIAAPGSLTGNYEIPDSVTSIGFVAFICCRRLTSVTIPDSVTSIGYGAFRDCSSLTSVTIPDSVTSIGEDAFLRCESLTSVTIPDSVTSIGDGVFCDCHSLTSITIPDSVTSIGENAFFYCESLTSVTIPDSVTSIDSFAFYGCSNLQRVIFSGYKGEAEKITIRRDNEDLLEAQWEYAVCPGHTYDDAYDLGCNICGELRTASYLDLTFSLNSDGKSYTITDCSSSASGDLVIPDMYDGKPVTAIGDQAFATCNDLTSVTIPDSVTHIGYDAFFVCYDLLGIWVDENNPNYSSDDSGVLFDKDKKTLLCAPCAIAGDYTIPDTVTRIVRHAFYQCSYLTEVTIPDSVAIIENYVFAHCNGLSELYIPAGTQLFSLCLQGCRNLTGIWVDAQNPYHSSDAYGVLFDKDQTCLVTAPGKLSGIYTIPDTVQTIASDAFSYCESLDGIILQKGVTTIQSSAFNSSGIKFAIIPESVSYIGSGAFWADELNHVFYCGTQEQWEAIEIDDINNGNLYRAVIHCDSSAEPLNMSRGCKYIRKQCAVCDAHVISEEIADGAHNFVNGRCSNCNLENIWEYTTNADGICITKYTGAATSVTVPETIEGIPVTELGDFLFSGCRALEEILLPDSIHTLNQHVFSECDRLKSVAMPNGLQEIGPLAFSACRSLTSITIPESLTYIDWGAFRLCDALASVYYYGDETQWSTIRVGPENEPLLNAQIIYNFSGIVAGDIDGDLQINTEDAVYLLLHTMFGEAFYPLNNAPADIDGSGTVDQDDAVYLLLHTMFGETFYPLNTPVLPVKAKE